MKATPLTARLAALAFAVLTMGLGAATARAQDPAQTPRPVKPVAPVRSPYAPADPVVRRVQDPPPPPAVTPPNPGGAGTGTAGNETDLTVPRAEKEGEPTNEVAAEEKAAEPAAKDETKLLMNWLGTSESKNKVYGWIQNSYTGNTNGVPKNAQNFGVNPNFLANRWMGNQYYLIFERTVEQNDEINFGYRVDNLFGNDWQFNHMQGLNQTSFQPNHFAGYDPAQMYVEMHVPDKFLNTKGIDIKGGRWYTLAGYEVVPATGRPLLSVPYMFNYGQPFTHFGALTTWHITDKFNLYNGAINGWDRWINTTYKWGYIGGFSWTFNEDKTNLAFTTIWGPNQFPSQLPGNQKFYPTGYINVPSIAGRRNNGYAANDRVLFTTVLSHKWSDRLTQVMETDQSFEQNVPGARSPVVNGVVQNGNSGGAGWYSFGNWFLYKITKDSDKLTGVWRSEIFRDNNGVRTGIATNYSEFTVGLIYKPKPYLWIRPEARYDFARSGHPYSDGTRNSQFTLGFDVILLF